MLHSLSNIEIDKYFKYDSRFNGLFSRHNLFRIKDGVYVINLDDKQSEVTHWVSLFIDKNIAVYFYCSVIEYISQEVLSKIKDKSITHNIFRIQDADSIMRGFYCIAFIEYMLSGKALLDYTNLFSPNDYQKNDRIIYEYFQDKYDKRKRKP